MSEADSKPERPKPAKKKRRLATLFFLVVVLGVGIAMVQGPALRYLIKEALVRGALLAGLEVVSVDVEASIGRPVILQNLKLMGREASNETVFSALEIVVEPVGLINLLRSRERLLARIGLLGVEGTLDLRELAAGGVSRPPSLSAEEEARQLEQNLRFLPTEIICETGALEVLLDDLRISMQDVSITLKENESGALSWAGLVLEADDWELHFPSSAATTTWKNGVLYLAEWPLLPVLHLNSCSLELFRPGAVALDLEAALFGGWLRGNVRLHSTAGAPPIELTLWAGDLDLADAVAFVDDESSDDARGVVRSLRVGFRGDPGDLPSSEATVRMIASQVSWQERGWEDLIVGVRLAQGRFTLSEFLLKQEDNRIEAQGELLWPPDNNFTDLKAIEGSIESTARIEDLSAIASLAGDQFTNLSGQLNLKTNLQWMRGEASGVLELSGDNWKWKEQLLGSATLKGFLEAEELKIQELAWKNGNDALDLSGQMRFSEPFVYSGKAVLHLENFARYFALAEPADLPEISGGLRLEWQGDGTSRAHSGAWNLSLEQLIIPEFPGGITGSLRGSYSPDNLFSECLLQREKLELSWNLVAGIGGIYADKINLRSGRTALLDGEIYFPWNPLVLLRGKDWTEGLLGEKNIYADLRTRRLELNQLAGLFGQEIAASTEFSGQLSASGPLESPELAGRLDFGRVRTAESTVQILDGGEFGILARGGRAEVEGKILIPKVEAVAIDPIVLKAAFPFGLALREGQIIWTDPLGDLQGIITLPGLDLSRFVFLFPGLQRLQGRLSGEIQLGRTLADPSIEGSILLRDGRVEIHHQSAEFTNLNMTARFDGDSLRFEETGGEIGAGPFQITGGASWQDPANPEIDLRVQGEQILLFRDRAMRLRADLDLAVAGGLGSGRISGAVNLVDGRIYQRLEITPLLQGAGPDTGAPLLLPDLAGLVPLPFGNWDLDVSVENKTPFLLVGNVASGSIEPAIRVVGKLGDPRPVGRVTLRDLRAFLPFGTVKIPEGLVNFLEDKPRSPEVDIRGFSQVLEYDIQLLMEGPLEEKNLILRSDPPLSQEQILLLLTAGIAPGTTSGIGMGQAIVGQGSLLVLKALLRNFEPDGVDLDSLLNRITVVTTPAPLPGLRSTLRGEFRVSENAAIYSERDGLGFLGGGVTYRIRFR